MLATSFCYYSNTFVRVCVYNCVYVQLKYYKFIIEIKIKHCICHYHHDSILVKMFKCLNSFSKNMARFEEVDLPVIFAYLLRFSVIFNKYRSYRMN